MEQFHSPPTSAALPQIETTMTSTAPLGIGIPGHTCTRYSLEGVEARLAEINEWIGEQPISGHVARFNWNAAEFGIVVIMDGREACFITN